MAKVAELDHLIEDHQSWLKDRREELAAGDQDLAHWQEQLAELKEFLRTQPDKPAK